MQLPPSHAIPIAWAEPKLSTCYQGGGNKKYNPDKEHDVVWYPNSNALGIQYHPEFMSPYSKGFKYAQELITRFFGLTATPVAEPEYDPMDFMD